MKKEQGIKHEVLEQRWLDVEVHKNEFGHLPERRCHSYHPLQCNRGYKYVCPHGVVHNTVAVCNTCLKKAVNAEK